jgi:tetratricopeptide (TPR) repeat protein
MNHKQFGEDRADFNSILQQYKDLRDGKSSRYPDEDSFDKIIEYFEENEQLKQALEACDIGLSIYAYSASLLLKKANILIDFRHYEAALQTLEKAELLDGISADLCVLKTEVYLAMDMQENAIDFLNLVLPQFEGEERIELLFELSDVYDDYEEFEKVFDVMVMILKEDPLNEEALYKICFWTDFTGRYDESIELHKALIDEYPYSELAWFNLGAAYQGLKLYEKSIDAYMYCTTIDEKFDYAYRNMGDAYIRLRKYKDAIESLEKVLELSRPEEVIHDAIGYCYDKLGQWAQARFHYRKASHLNPEDSKLVYKVACTYHNEGKFEAAYKQLEQTLKMNPENADYNLAMGLVLAEKNDFDTALLHLGKVIHHKPKNIRAWASIIECLMAKEDWANADYNTQLAHLNTGHKPVFLFYRVAVLFNWGKIKDALEELEMAMHIDSRQIKKLIEICPRIIQDPRAAEIISRHKKKRGK